MAGGQDAQFVEGAVNSSVGSRARPVGTAVGLDADGGGARRSRRRTHRNDRTRRLDTGRRDRRAGQRHPFHGVAGRDRSRRVRRLPPAVGEVARRHRMVLGCGVELLRHPGDDTGRHGARRPGNAWGAVVSRCDAELRDRGVPARDRRVSRHWWWRARTVRRSGRGRGCGRRPPRSPTTCAGSASSRGTGSSDTCRTSARRSPRSSGRPAWVRPGRCATRTSPSTVWSRGSASSSRRCWWPATVRSTPESVMTAARNSPRSGPNCRL